MRCLKNSWPPLLSLKASNSLLPWSRHLAFMAESCPLQSLWRTAQFSQIKFRLKKQTKAVVCTRVTASACVLRAPISHSSSRPACSCTDRLGCFPTPCQKHQPLAQGKLGASRLRNTAQDQERTGTRLWEAKAEQEIATSDPLLPQILSAEGTK